MNRLVREHYPVSKLPEDLREGLDGVEDVTVTVEAERVPKPASDRVNTSDQSDVAGESWVERGRRVRQVNFASDDEVDAYIRSLRD